MDAVKEAQSAFAPVLKEWASEIPQAFRTIETFKQFEAELPTMYGAGYALGLDPGAEVIATLTGSLSGGTPTLKSATRSRSRTRARTRSRSGTRGNGAGHPGPTGEQVLTFMQKMGHPCSQSEIAEHFGVTRQTIARRLETLVGDGLVTTHGDGARKTWRAKELIAA